MTEPPYIALRSLPIPIPWIDGATATYDLIRCVDLVPIYDDVMAPYLDEAARIDAAREAIPPDAADRAAQLAALAEAGRANNEAAHLFLLGYTRCQVGGINPTPVPDQPDTWAHLHPSLRGWLAMQGRVAAGAQLQSPLARLRRQLSPLP
jgi:hypothetical protein